MTTSADVHVDIAIVGAGIVGATLASLLAGSEITAGLSVALIDKQASQLDVDLEHFDPRVVALSPASQTILKTAGAWDEITSMRACAYRRMYVWDADGTGHIAFDARDMRQDALGHICENSVVVAALNRALSEVPNVHQLRPVDVVGLISGDEPRLLLADGRSVSSKLVLAADGAHSEIRRLAGFDMREWHYQHHAIVTTLETEHSHEFCAWQRFSTDGPLAYLPLSRNGTDDRSVSIVWSLRSGVAKKNMALKDSAFCEAAAVAMEKRLGNIKKCDTRVSVPLMQRSARQYIKPGVALVGDAAHTIHPLAGQGLNLGLYDAHTIVAQIQRATQRKLPLNDMSVLRRYERARQPENLMAMAAMEGFKQTFGSDNIFVRWARNTGLNVVDQHFFLKRVFAQVAAGRSSGG